MPLQKTTSVTTGVFDKVIVNYLGSLMAKLPDGVSGLVGSNLVGLSWIVYGVFKFSTFDDAWDQQMIQQILDWANYIGMTGVGVEGVNRLANASAPDDTPDGKLKSTTEKKIPAMTPVK